MSSNQLSARHRDRLAALFQELRLTDACRDLDWMDRARCIGVDPDLFFLPRGDRWDQTQEAKAICRQCPVRMECLSFAVATTQKFGIWGGLSERERRELRHLRREAVRA
jgi:WhiB family redox-sensing transcriptional regulator